MNLAVAQAARLGVGAGSRVLLFASPGFDASVWELAMGLCSGACLVAAPAGSCWRGRGWPRWWRGRAITHLTVPPAVLAGLAAGELGPVRTLVAAGEALDGGLVARWAAGREGAGIDKRLRADRGDGVRVDVGAADGRCRPRYRRAGG